MTGTDEFARPSDPAELGRELAKEAFFGGMDNLLDESRDELAYALEDETPLTNANWDIALQTYRDTLEILVTAAYAASKYLIP